MKNVEITLVKFELEHYICQSFNPRGLEERNSRYYFFSQLLRNAQDQLLE